MYPQQPLANTRTFLCVHVYQLSTTYFFINHSNSSAHNCESPLHHVGVIRFLRARPVANTLYAHSTAPECRATTGGRVTAHMHVPTYVHVCVNCECGRMTNKRGSAVVLGSPPPPLHFVKGGMPPFSHAFIGYIRNTYIQYNG